MAHPDLWKGICCICMGTLTPENTLYEDCGEGRGGLHKGVCAYHAGDTSPEHQKLSELFSELLVKMDNKDPLRDVVFHLYDEWIRSLGLEDHYDHSGPGDDS